MTPPDKNSLPKISSGDPAKDDILNCLMQLGQRAHELGYTDLASSIYTVAGAGGIGLDGDKLLAGHIAKATESLITLTLFKAFMGGFDAESSSSFDSPPAKEKPKPDDSKHKDNLL